MYCVLCRPSLPFLVLPFLDFVSLRRRASPILKCFGVNSRKRVQRYRSSVYASNTRKGMRSRNHQPQAPLLSMSGFNNTYKATVRSSLASARFAYSGARRYSTGRVTAVRSCSRRSCIRFQIFPIAFCCSGVCRLQNLKHAACTRARSTE